MIAFSILASVVLLVALTGIVHIPNNRVGVVEKRFSRRGSVKSGLIALGGHSGVDVVPRVIVGQTQQTNVLESLLAVLLSAELGEQPAAPRETPPAVAAIKKRLRDTA